jgi:signal peptidase II
MTKWLALAAAAILTAVDQAVKLWAINVLEPLGRMTVIPGIFNLTFVQNRGAAFGILQGKTVFLSIVVALVLAGGLYLLLSGKITSAS